MCRCKGTIAFSEMLVSFALCDSLLALWDFGQGRGIGGVRLGWVFCGSGLVLFLLRKKDIFD